MPGFMICLWTPYEEWSRYLISLLKEYGVSDGIVLDLGCGTGKMTRLLSRAGYDMIGIDNSEEMLQIAREASDSESGPKGYQNREGQRIFYICCRICGILNCTER